MGCISSKAITRSMSIREELMSHGFQSRTSVWEDLLTSHGSYNDQQLFAFVCSSNSNSNSNSRLKTTATFTLPSSQTPNTSNNIYLVDLITDITTAKAEAEAEAEAAAAAAPDHVAVGHPDSCKFTRSKSLHSLREKEMLSENRLNLEDKNVGGSRSLSFHTVEEYDALLERIHGARNLGSFQDWDDVELQRSTSLSEDGNERCNVATISRDSGEDSGSVNETGWKRKAVAKGLKSLDISSSSSSPPLEFPDIAARIKQRRMLVQGQIYSPGTYVTPKFGSYNDPTAIPQNKNEYESGENTAFSPELLAAFEDCMKQLQLEEDTILRHMDHDFSLEEENQVANPSNMYKAMQSTYSHSKI